MQTQDLERKIKEQRTIEATKNNLMGFDGKIGCIVRNLGEKIIAHEEGWGSVGDMSSRSSNPLDFWSLEDEEPKNAIELVNKLPTMDTSDMDPVGEEWKTTKTRTSYSVFPVGLIFDGLSRGMHLEIKFMNESKELTVYYQGYLVYKEMNGDLRCYVTSKEWESMIDRLYEQAKKMDKKRKGLLETERKIIGQEEKKTWLKWIQSLWGDK